jgi:hypothetical protein
MWHRSLLTGNPERELPVLRDPGDSGTLCDPLKLMTLETPRPATFLVTPPLEMEHRGGCGVQEADAEVGSRDDDPLGHAARGSPQG